MSPVRRNAIVLLLALLLVSGGVRAASPDSAAEVFTAVAARPNACRAPLPVLVAAGSAERPVLLSFAPDGEAAGCGDAAQLSPAARVAPLDDGFAAAWVAAVPTEEGTGWRDELRLARVERTGAPGNPLELADAPHGTLAGIDLAAGPGSSLGVCWRERGTDGDRVAFAALDGRALGAAEPALSGAPAWRAALELVPGTRAEGPRLAWDGWRAAWVVAWIEIDTAGARRLVAARLDARGETLAPPRAIEVAAPSGFSLAAGDGMIAVATAAPRDGQHALELHLLTTDGQEALVRSAPSIALAVASAADGPGAPAIAWDGLRGLFRLAWVEAPGSLRAAAFDAEGRAVEPAAELATGDAPGGGLALAVAGGRTLALWGARDPALAAGTVDGESGGGEGLRLERPARLHPVRRAVRRNRQRLRRLDRRGLRLPADVVRRRGLRRDRATSCVGGSVQDSCSPGLPATTSATASTTTATARPTRTSPRSARPAAPASGPAKRPAPWSARSTAAPRSATRSRARRRPTTRLQRDRRRLRRLDRRGLRLPADVVRRRGLRRDRGDLLRRRLGPGLVQPRASRRRPLRRPRQRLRRLDRRGDRSALRRADGERCREPLHRRGGSLRHDRARGARRVRRRNGQRRRRDLRRGRHDRQAAGRGRQRDRSQHAAGRDQHARRAAHPVLRRDVGRRRGQRGAGPRLRAHRRPRAPGTAGRLRPEHGRLRVPPRGPARRHRVAQRRRTVEPAAGGRHPRRGGRRDARQRRRPAGDQRERQAGGQGQPGPQQRRQRRPVQEPRRGGGEPDDCLRREPRPGERLRADRRRPRRDRDRRRQRRPVRRERRQPPHRRLRRRRRPRHRADRRRDRDLLLQPDPAERHRPQRARKHRARRAGRAEPVPRPRVRRRAGRSARPADDRPLGHPGERDRAGEPREHRGARCARTTGGARPAAPLRSERATSWSARSTRPVSSRARPRPGSSGSPPTPAGTPRPTCASSACSRRSMPPWTATWSWRGRGRTTST